MRSSSPSPLPTAFLLASCLATGLHRLLVSAKHIFFEASTDRRPLLLVLTLEALPDVLGELDLAEGFRRLHVINVLQKGLVVRLHTRVNVSAGVHQQALPDVLDRETGFISDVELVETLGNNLVKILIEELHHAHYRLIKGELVCIIHGKEARYS